MAAAPLPSRFPGIGAGDVLGFFRGLLEKCSRGPLHHTSGIAGAEPGAGRKVQIRGSGRGRRTAACEVAWGWGRCFLHFAGVRVDPRLLSGIARGMFPGSAAIARAEPGAGRKVQIRGSGRGRRTAACEVAWGWGRCFLHFAGARVDPRLLSGIARAMFPGSAAPCFGVRRGRAGGREESAGGRDVAAAPLAARLPGGGAAAFFTLRGFG